MQCRDSACVSVIIFYYRAHAEIAWSNPSSCTCTVWVVCCSYVSSSALSFCFLLFLFFPPVVSLLSLLVCGKILWRAVLKCDQWAEQGNDVSNDPKQGLNWDVGMGLNPPPSPQPTVLPPPCPPHPPLNCCFWGFRSFSVQGAPSPPWLEALDNAVILYLSPGSRFMSTDARILSASFHSIRSWGWRRSKRLINFKSL